ncbi:hypothetical protein [Thermococcus sp.]|uniref:hypothetical protein n=1 Tax=Thermococcus sp. TaxID=35749 RepID=UPI0026054CB3|nr:hypothetical protein [Thermococcus sp.]
MKRWIMLGFMFFVLVLMVAKAPNVSAATDYCLKLDPSTEVQHSYNLPIGASGFYVQWDSTMNQSPGQDVTLMKVAYTDSQGYTPSFTWSAAGHALYACFGGTCHDVTDYAGGITLGTWHTLKIEISETQEELHSYTITVNWYIDGTNVYGQTYSTTQPPTVDYTSASTKSDGYLFIDNVQDSQGNTDDCGDNYFTVTQGSATCVSKDSVPFFSSVAVGLLVVLGMLLLFRRR